MLAGCGVEEEGRRTIHERGLEVELCANCVGEEVLSLLSIYNLLSIRNALVRCTVSTRTEYGGTKA